MRVAEYTFRAQIADRWRDRRIFLLGDAAHLTPPFIGQGMGAGLRDAANLAWKLAAVLSGHLPDHLADIYLDTYEAERKPHARAMIRLAKLIGTVMTGGGELGKLARRLVAPRLHHLPGVKDHVLDSRTPPLRRTALVARPRLRRTSAGQLCPNTPVDAAHRVRRPRRRAFRPGHHDRADPGPAARDRAPRRRRHHRRTRFRSAPVAAPGPYPRRPRAARQHRPAHRPRHSHRSSTI